MAALTPIQVRWLVEPGFEPRRIADRIYQIGPNQQLQLGMGGVDVIWERATFDLVHDSLAVLLGLVAAQIGMRAYRSRLAAEHSPTAPDDR